MSVNYSLTTVTATSVKNTSETTPYSITGNFSTNRSDIIRIKIWTLTKNANGVGTANFVPIPENNSISLHFNIRETTTVINSNSGGWGSEIFVHDIHNLPNPSTITISFHVIDGWKIEYVVSGVQKIVTLPNRLNVTSVDKINDSPVIQWNPTNMMSITSPSILEKNVTLVYSVPTNNYCTITNSGTITPNGSSQSTGNAVTVTATLSGEGISSALTATHTINFLKTPVYTGGLSTGELFYNNIGSIYTPSAPTTSSFAPNLVSPSYTYSISYLSNQTYAATYIPVATISNSSLPGSTIVGTGMCYYTVTVPANVSAFLDTVTANFHLLTVRPGYIIGPNVDLTDAVIQNYDLNSINFSSCNLKNAKIINCLLADTNFTNAVFTNATFTYNTILSTTNFNGADFTGLISNDNSGTTTNISSSSWEIKGGKIVASGSVFFSLAFVLENPSTTLPSNTGLSTVSPHPYVGDGHYSIVNDSLTINGRIETATAANMAANNILFKNSDRYDIAEVIAVSESQYLYLFQVIYKSSESKFYVRRINTSTNEITAINDRAISSVVSYKIATPLPSGYYLRGSYLFGSNMVLSYFDNTISPKPDLSNIDFNTITFLNTGGDSGLYSTSTNNNTIIKGWILSGTKFINGTFQGICFSDCNCNATDFSGSNLNNTSFKITYTSKNVALSNIATLQNAKFTNCQIDNLTITGYDDDPSTPLNQMNVSDLDFSGAQVTYITTYFLNRTGNGPKNMLSSAIGRDSKKYGYSMVFDSLIGRFLVGPGTCLKGITLGNANFSGTNLSNIDISGTNLASTSLYGVSMRDGSKMYYSSTTVLPTGYRIAKPKVTSESIPAYIVGRTLRVLIYVL